MSSIRMQTETNYVPELSNRTAREPRWTFVVTRGTNTAASYDLAQGASVYCGTDIDNDIILSAGSGNAEWKVKLYRENNDIFLTTLQGAVVSDDGIQLTLDQEIVVERKNEFSIGDTAFSISFPKPTMLEDSQYYAATPLESGSYKSGSGSRGPQRNNQRHFARYALYVFSLLCIALGILSGMYAVTGSVILANADTVSENKQFMESIRDSELAYLEVKQIGDTNKYQVSGTVNTREEKNKLNRIAKESGAEVAIQIQVNDEVLESIEDIFRVNGIQAKAQITDAGSIRVLTQTADTNKLDNVRQVVRRDIPSMSTLEIVNTPPVVRNTPKKRTYKPAPNKRITLISAGQHAYIMTQDKSRYFVGGLLPSGHRVEEIQEGVVIVSMDGKLETLKY